MIATSIYDYPEYYDTLFSWDRDLEAQLYGAAFGHYGVAEGGRLLEVGCGTGQVAIRLARRGWRVTGLDLSPAMLAYLRDAAGRAGVTVETLCADMRDFAIQPPMDGAYCPLGTFGHLLDDGDAVRHLRCLGQALRPGGVCILDMGLAAESAAEVPVTEEWAMCRGDVEVASEGCRIRVSDPSRPSLHTLTWGPPLRGYTSQEVAGLAEESGCFAVEALHPEGGRAAGGISFFSVARTAILPFAGRAMMVLRRLP